MEKPFFDVFPTLELNTELKNLFAVTKVTRVALTKARDFLKVYLFSEKLIQKKYIYQVEKAIRDQLFAASIRRKSSWMSIRTAFFWN